MGEEEISVIVNPTAAGGAVGHEWPDLRAYLKAQGLRFRDTLTEAPGHATELALEAVRQGYPTVVAVGGDGTLNEVVNGLYNGNGSTPTTELAIVSRGTGCDLVRTLGLRDPKRAILALTERRTTRTIDVGEILMERGGHQERRLFLNAAGLGFDAEVVEGLLHHRYTGRKIGGTVPYLLQVFRSIVRYDNKRVRASVDGEVSEGCFTAFFACNGRYFGGGMKVAPQADPDDGLFDVVVIRAVSRLGLLARLPTVYFGWHTIFPEIEIRRARELKVETEDRILIEADGELVGTAPATLRVIPSGLRVRV
ncbi:MAG: diacylglycerol/lipid kinase family protein [Anaerolineae bacterium]|jgi:YegS/Rv2252/BmrU family lipid kinase